MDKIHILVAVPFLKEVHLARIAAVDPGVVVHNVMAELQAELGITVPSVLPAGNKAEVKARPGEASARLDKILAHTGVILSFRVPLHVTSRAPHLKWIQTIGAGIDHVVKNTDVLKSDVMVTNASGVNSSSVAEYVIYLMLMLAKRAPRLFANNGVRRWERLPTLEMEGRTLGIVGLGRTGSKVARLGRALGMKVLATRRSAAGRQKDVNGVDELFPAGELLQMLRISDFVILTLPLTPETRGIIGEAELRAMKPTAYIINVARGPVVQQAALRKALKEGWIAGAGLDVFENEPLPPDDDL
ncbi:MAG: hypothetical protein A2144_14420, partial [Chloroflexi bacterium RBG_16_50_9]